MGTTYRIHPAIGVARLGTARPDPARREGYYLAPEAEGALPSDPATGEPVRVFRDAEGKLLKQAARFQVYAYQDDAADGVPVVPGGAVQAIEWTVYLANKKAAWYQFEQLTGSGLLGDKGYLENGPTVNPLRVNDQVADRRQLILDPGPRTVGGARPAAASFDLPAGPTTDQARCKPFPIRQLGSLYAEDGGGLLVFAADGNAGTTNLRPADPGKPPRYEYAITRYANNAGWFDDVADGPVSATLILDDGSRVPVDVPAWCLAAPPKYAPQIVNMVTLFDAIYDVAVREQGYRPDIYDNGSYVTSYRVDFEREIAPLIRRPDINRWVVDLQSGPAVSRHQEIARLEADEGVSFPIQFVRSPDQVNDPRSPLIRMPRLAGDNPINRQRTPSLYMALTQTQIFLLRQWMAGLVEPTRAESQQPAGVAIDHGVLANCVGGAFCPGIEMTWICLNKHIYAEPFRIRVKRDVTPGRLDPLNGDDNRYPDGLEPGDLSKYMAQPWLADFNECSTQGDISRENPGADWWWWPAQRPYDVFPEAAPTTYARWTRGYRTADGGTFTNPSLGDMQMVIDWQHLGFVLEHEKTFLEIERQSDEIDRYQDPLLPAED